MERESILENKDQITKQVELETERRTLKQLPYIEHDAWLVAAVDEDGHGREGGDELGARLALDDHKSERVQHCKAEGSREEW
jgi:hypothetical protein